MSGFSALCGVDAVFVFDAMFEFGPQSRIDTASATVQRLELARKLESAKPGHEAEQESTHS